LHSGIVRERETGIGIKSLKLHDTSIEKQREAAGSTAGSVDWPLSAGAGPDMLMLCFMYKSAERVARFESRVMASLVTKESAASSLCV
jgi:hypothetical protein